MGFLFFGVGLVGLALDGGVLWCCFLMETEWGKAMYAALAWLAALRAILQLYLMGLHVRKRRFGVFRPALWLLVHASVVVVKLVEQVVMEYEPVAERWASIGLTLGSIICQGSCVKLLRSSAVSLKTKHVFLRAAPPSGGIAGSAGGATAAAAARAAASPSASAGLLSPPLQALGTPWDHAMTRMRLRWREHVDALRDRATDAGLYRRLQGPMNLLVRLYAHSGDPNHDQLLQNLESDYDASPEKYFSYLRQYTLFLLYGSFGCSEALERFLLQRSRSNVHVAHAIYWFTISFCLHGAGVSPSGVEAIESFIQRLVSSGEQPALDLWQGKGPGEQGPAALHKAETTTAATANGDDEREFLSQSALEVFYTKDDARRSLPYVGSFSAAPSFIDALCQISKDLVVLPREERTEELRRRLRVVDDAYLPSTAIYLPVGNWRHRVFRIIWDESLVFSTKDRAPLLITVEVIDYCRSDPVGRRGSFFKWAEDRLRAVSNTFKNSAPSFSNSDPLIGEEEDEKRVSYGTLGSSNSASQDLGQWGDHKASREVLSADRDDGSVGGLGWGEGNGIIPFGRSFFDRSPSPSMLSKGSSRDSFIGGNAGEEEEEDVDVESQTPALGSTGTSDMNGSSGGDAGDLAKTEVRPPVVFAEPWKVKEARIRAQSPIGNHPGWRLLPVIVKSGDPTLRQEELASQLIEECANILKAEGVGIWLRPYSIRATDSEGGLIEAIPDTVSLDALKKNSLGFTSLLDFYVEHFGEQGSPGFRKAQLRFIRSMAGYSVICYLLQIKDRHNGNILLTRQGHVVHIDYGFLLDSSPGGNIGFESAPFKLTAEMVAVMGGEGSPAFTTFRKLYIKAFMALRRHTHRITLLLELSAVGNSHLPCFGGRPRMVVDELRARLMPDRNDDATVEAVESLIKASGENWRTAFYDKYQTLNDIRE